MQHVVTDDHFGLGDSDDLVWLPNLIQILCICVDDDVATLRIMWPEALLVYNEYEIAGRC